jgi:hypothetical protein
MIVPIANNIGAIECVNVSQGVQGRRIAQIAFQALRRSGNAPRATLAVARKVGLIGATQVSSAPRSTVHVLLRGVIPVSGPDNLAAGQRYQLLKETNNARAHKARSHALCVKGEKRPADAIGMAHAAGMKFKGERPFATPEAAKRTLLEVANAMKADLAKNSRIAEPAYAAAKSIRKSSIRLPDSSCTVSHCGCFPRPVQVSEGRVGLRYFGKTGG